MREGGREGRRVLLGCWGLKRPYLKARAGRKGGRGVGGGGRVRGEGMMEGHVTLTSEPFMFPTRPLCPGADRLPEESYPLCHEQLLLTGIPLICIVTSLIALRHKGVRDGRGYSDSVIYKVYRL